MSNYYLCDYCEYQHDSEFVDYSEDIELCNVGEMEPKVMSDGLDPNDVCGSYEPRKNE